MTSIGFGDILPLTNTEKITALLVMIIGASTYAGLFGSFVNIIDDLNHEERENRQKLEHAKQWIEVRDLDDNLKNRIITYYTIVRTKFYNIGYYSTME